MFVRYTPEGTDKTTEWAFRADKLLNAESEEIERRTGMDFSDWVQKLPPATISIRALHGLLFVLLKRDVPTLKWENVAFNVSELEFELELDEKVDFRDSLKNLLAEGKVPDELVEATQEQIDAFDTEIAAVHPAIDEDHMEPEAPKDPVAPNSESGGGLRSLPNSTSIPATSTA
jgi:hypothetical protein